MRKFALTTLVAAVALAVMATPGFAINSVLKFDARFSPTTVGTKKKPQAITLFTRPYYDTLAPDADAPFAWKQARIWFPREGVFNGKHFPSCSASEVRTESGRNRCKKAEVGKVDAKGFALGLVEPLKVKLYNLPRGAGVALWLQGDNPVIIDHVVEGRLTTVKGDPLFGYKLTFDVPPDLIQPAPGAYATALDFKVTVPARTITKKKKKRVKVKVHGRRVTRTRTIKTKYPYIGTTGCPKSGFFTAKFETDNTDGTTSSVTATAPCKKAKASRKASKSSKKKFRKSHRKR
jgi:hypothetical protein